MSYSSRFDQAVTYARVIHAAQVRKGSAIPYLTHLLSVAALVGEHGGTEDQVIGALLHDSAEDQGGSARLADVRLHFGEGVAAIVAACSDSLAVDAAAKKPWKERKEAYVAAIPRKVATSHLVAAADKLHNLTCTLVDVESEGMAAFGKFNAGHSGQLWYYREIVRALERTTSFDEPLSRRLLKRLARAVDALEQVK